jgi:hypothetical protein
MSLVSHRVVLGGAQSQIQERPYATSKETFDLKERIAAAAARSSSSRRLHKTHLKKIAKALMCTSAFSAKNRFATDQY